MRIRTILAAAAAPLALGGVLLTTTAASASTGPGGPNPASVVEVHQQSDLDQLIVNGAINKNFDVASGASVKLEWTTVNANVSIASGGQLAMNGDNINGNVTDHGFLSLFNFATEIHGNLIVTGSSGTYEGSWAPAAFGDWTSYAGGAANLPPVPGSVTTANPNGIGQSQVDGGFTFTGNAATALTNNMGGGGPLHIEGKFTYVHGSAVNPYDGQTYPLNYQGGLQVDGQQSVS
jgi:hypothetical protein